MNQPENDQSAAGGSPLQQPVGRLEPERAAFDRATALVLLSAAAKSCDPGAISLAAQLAGAAPCAGCMFVWFHCRCGSRR